jgi:hypothetical protein
MPQGLRMGKSAGPLVSGVRNQHGSFLPVQLLLIKRGLLMGFLSHFHEPRFGYKTRRICPNSENLHGPKQILAKSSGKVVLNGKSPMHVTNKSALASPAPFLSSQDSGKVRTH